MTTERGPAVEGPDTVSIDTESRNLRYDRWYSVLFLVCSSPVTYSVALITSSIKTLLESERGPAAEGADTVSIDTKSRNLRYHRWYSVLFLVCSSPVTYSVSLITSSIKTLLESCT
jgi:ethanolamine utilization protein EutP (predicted NTPase)